jgi:hypothetical protein
MGKIFALELTTQTFYSSAIVRLLHAEIINSICMPATCSYDEAIDFLNSEVLLLEDFEAKEGGSCKELEDLSVMEPIDVVTM